MQNTSPETQLWLSVLVRVHQDLFNVSPHAYDEFRNAQLWVGDYPSRDVREVCSLAGVEPDFLHRRLAAQARETMVQYNKPAQARSLAAE